MGLLITIEILLLVFFVAYPILMFPAYCVSCKLDKKKLGFLDFFVFLYL